MKKVKEDIKEIVIKITNQEKKRARKQIRAFKKDINTQSRRMTSKKMTDADKEKARNDMLFLKASLNKMEENRMEKARKSAQARFLNEGEQCSKYWFT